jgi:hypothetical protein
MRVIAKRKRARLLRRNLPQPSVIIQRGDQRRAVHPPQFRCAIRVIAHILRHLRQRVILARPALYGDMTNSVRLNLSNPYLKYWTFETSMPAPHIEEAQS